MKGSHGRNQEAGTEAEAMAGVSAASWLAHYGLHSLLSESARDRLPRIGTAHCELDPLVDQSSNKAMTYRLVYRALGGGAFPTEALLQVC